jgi:hypothetical protein
MPAFFGSEAKNGFGGNDINYKCLKQSVKNNIWIYEGWSELQNYVQHIQKLHGFVMQVMQIRAYFIFSSL